MLPLSELWTQHGVQLSAMQVSHLRQPELSVGGDLRARFASDSARMDSRLGRLGMDTRRSLQPLSFAAALRHGAKERKTQTGPQMPLNLAMTREEKEKNAAAARAVA